MFKKLLADKQKRLYAMIIGAAIIVLAIIIICIAAASDAQRLIYTERADGTYEVTDVKNMYRGGLFLKNKITIPATHKGKEVTSVKRIESEYIKEIVVSEGISIIEASAFSGMKSLEKITLPSSVISLGDKAFSTCDLLKEVTLPEKITKIGNGLFNKCFSLEAIEIPQSVTEIGSNAFEGCSSLTEIKISTNVKSIGDEAFIDCKNLKTVQCDITNIEMGSLVFSGTQFEKDNCDSNGYFIINNVLYGVVSQESELTIPEGVKVVAKGALSGNTKAIKVYLPSTLEKIENNAFANATKIKEVYVKSNCEIQEKAFDKLNSLVVLSFENELNAEYVKLFANKTKVNVLLSKDGSFKVAVYLTKEAKENNDFTLLDFDFTELAGYKLEGEEKVFFDKAKYEFK